MRKSQILQLTLIFVVLLNFVQVLQETIRDLFNLITNSKLMELLPAAASYTMAIISLVLSPILIALEIKEMSKRKTNDPKNIVSIIKIFLLSTAMLISASSLLGFELPVILLSTIPVAGVILAACTVLYQLAKKFNKTDNYKQKAAFIFLGILVLGMSYSAILGTLSVTAVLVVLIAAFIFNSANRYKAFKSNFKKMLKTFNKNENNTEIIPSKQIKEKQLQNKNKTEAHQISSQENSINEETQSQIEKLTKTKAHQISSQEKSINEKTQSQENSINEKTQSQKNSINEKTQSQKNSINEETQSQIEEISNENQIEQLTKIIKNLKNEIKTLKQSQDKDLEINNEAPSNTKTN